jgi:hypothetical protein
VWVPCRGSNQWVAEPSQGVNLSLGALMRLVAFLEAGELLIEKTRRAAR